MVQRRCFFGHMALEFMRDFIYSIQYSRFSELNIESEDLLGDDEGLQCVKVGRTTIFRSDLE